MQRKSLSEWIATVDACSQADRSIVGIYSYGGDIIPGELTIPLVLVFGTEIVVG